MTRLKIALMAGGDSPEREIALQSAAQIESALDAVILSLYFPAIFGTIMPNPLSPKIS